MDTIHLEPDGRGSFTFTFSSTRGEMSGRVNVGTEGRRLSVWQGSRSGGGASFAYHAPYTLRP